MVTAEEVRAEQSRTEKVVRVAKALINLSLLGKPWFAENYLDGLIVRMHVFPFDEHIYVYALPWSRGWSIFVSDQDGMGCYDWRNVKAKYKGLQRPLYCPKDTVGPWRVNGPDIADAVLDMTNKIEKLHNARLIRFAKKHWYWGNTILANKLGGLDAV